MRNVLTIASLRSTRSRARRPARRSRRCAPISTPSDDESMNVVVGQVDDRRACDAASIGADTRCLNSGAVNRSISPVTATTCVSSSTARSSIAKVDGHRGCHPRRRVPIRRSSSRAPAYSSRTCRNSRSPSGATRELVGELLDHVADARHGGVDDQRVAAAGAQRADAQRERARAGLEGRRRRPVQHVRGRARGDQVGDQHGVVEPVERQVGAGGEHADDAAQDRAHERAGGDRDGRRRVDAAGLVVTRRPRGACRDERHRHAAAAAGTAGARPRRRSRRSAAGRGRAGRVRAGADAAPVVGTTTLTCPPSAGSRSPPGRRLGRIGMADDVRARLGDREPQVLDEVIGQPQRLGERAEHVTDHRHVLRACAGSVSLTSVSRGAVIGGPALSWGCA